MNYFALAADTAKGYRDDVLRARAPRQAPDLASSVIVVPLVVGPDGSLVPCGEASFARAVADQFEAGRLTITAIDDGADLRIYEPSTWAECTVYGPDNHILYSWRAA